MNPMELRQILKGKSKREALAILPKDTKVNYFETGKGIPEMMTLYGGAWNLLGYSVFFDKKTRRIV